MAFFIFTQGKRSKTSWELLETISRPDVAREAYGNYRRLVGQNDLKIVMVEAPSAAAAKAELVTVKQAA